MKSNNDRKQVLRSCNPLPLQVLASRGVNMSAPRLIYHVFYISTREKAEQLAELLQMLNYRINTLEKSRGPRAGSIWTVVATKLAVANVDSLDSMTDECLEAASSIGEEYDGWYAELKRGSDYT